MGIPISKVVYVFNVSVCKMALIKNNDIYIFAILSAILNLCKLYNHVVERRGSVHKRALQNI